MTGAIEARRLLASWGGGVDTVAVCTTIGYMKTNHATPMTFRLSPRDRKNLAAILKANPPLRTKVDAVRYALEIAAANTERKAS